MLVLKSFFFTANDSMKRTDVVLADPVSAGFQPKGS